MKVTFQEIKEYYLRNFGDGRRLYAFFRDQIANDAGSLGINWGAVEPELSWLPGQRLGLNQQRFLKKGTKTHSVYANYRELEGIITPMITINNRGMKEAAYVFDGWKELAALVESDRGFTDLNDRRKQHLQTMADKLEQQELKARRKAEQEALEREQSRLKDCAAYPMMAPLADSKYINKKGLWGIVPHVDGLKQGDDDRGHFMAIPLFGVTSRSLADTGDVVGLQRIYDTPFTRKSGETTDKDFTYGLNKLTTGAHAQIGNLATADRVYFCEGWATGATAYLAHNAHLVGRHGEAAVVVCLDSGQLKVVMDMMMALWPWLLDKAVVLLDNDRHKASEGKGNAGLLTGHELQNSWPSLICQVPDLSEADSCSHGTDFDDLRQGHRKALQEVARQISSTDFRLTRLRDPFERELAIMAITPKQSLQKQVERVAIIGANSFPVQRTLPQIARDMEAVELANPWMERAIDWKKVKDRIERHVYWRRKRAHLFRSFGSRITRKAERPEHIQYHAFDTTRIDSNILQFIKSLPGIIIVRAPMGSGKTQRLIKPLMWDCEKAAYFAHRVSLIGAAHNMLTSRAKDGSEAHVPGYVLDGIFHYHERDNFRDLAVKKLCSCINSINKDVFNPILNKLDVLAIDEASQTIKAITNGGTMKNPLRVYNRLKAVAASAQQVLLMDADANDSLVQWAEEVREMRADGLPIHVIDLKTDCSHLTVYHSEIDAVFADIIKQVGDGKRVMVADDSADEGEKLALQLRTLYPERRGLFISQDTKTHDELVQRFNDSPSQEIHKYDWVIYSPAISSGVSIEVELGQRPRMDLHYGLFRGVVSPSDAVQMIRRDRSATTFILGLGSQHGYKQDDEQAYWRATVRGMVEQPAELGISFNAESGAIELTSGNLSFDRMRIKQVCDENAARNDFANVLLMQLMADRYNVLPLALENQEEMAAKGEQAKKQAGDTLRQLDVERVMAATSPSDERREHLLKLTHISQDEKAELDRWNIEHYLQSQVTPDTIKWLRAGGMSHAKRFELLQMNEDRAKRLDQAEIEQGMPISTRTSHAVNNRLLRDYLTTCGIDLETGEGQATQESLQAGMNMLMAEADFLNHYASWCPLLRKQRRGGDLFKAIMENLNLEAERVRLSRRSAQGATVWSITKKSWQLMMDIHQAREFCGITSFEEWKVRQINRPVRLLMGIGKASITMQTISQQKAAQSALRPFRDGIYATPANTYWRQSPEAVTLAPQPPHVDFVREVIRLALPSQEIVPVLPIHDFADDLKAHSEVVDPRGSATGSVLVDVVALVREVAEGLSCGVREVLQLLSPVDLYDLAAGELNKAWLVEYVKGCRASHGPLFGYGV